MRFSPNESRVDQPNFAQSLELAETNGQELPRFHVADDPLRRRREVARASLAPIHGGLFWDPFGNIDRVSETVYAEVGSVWFDWSSTVSAENVGCLG